MVNLSLFPSRKNKTVAHEAGGRAYALNPRAQLAQLAATGCLNDTFYASGGEQLEQVQALCQGLDDEFIAKTAVFCRQKGYMKDMPALLLALLTARRSPLLPRLFPLIIDNGKMLRNFAQLIRSGQTGRKSFGSQPKKLIQQWLTNASERQLLNAAIGQTPSLADLVKMMHPKPADPAQAQWFRWLIGRDYQEEQLPPLTRAFERYRRAGGPMPAVPFQMFTNLPLDTKQWAELARNGSWQQLRQGLNTFARHGVFKDWENVRWVAERLADEKEIRRARVFPYQLLTSFQATGELPRAIGAALEQALEIAVANVPALEGKVYLCPDVSGSMSWPLTGHRRGATASTRCIDVAALLTAAVLRHNHRAQVLPFDTDVRPVKLAANASIMENAGKLAAIQGGGTACSAPLALLNREKRPVDLLLMISDNESWADFGRGGKTSLQGQWEILKKRCPQAKLVCIDLQPYGTVQNREHRDVLHVGGFSDQVFNVIADFYRESSGPDHWVQLIEAVDLGA